ncbi:MAG TPA: HNH endonuclease [Ktedonobacterales bacterium]|nr:HNH endonuclease [Ktedonobacterales bacterium]
MMLHPLLQRQQHLLVLAIERCALPLPTKKFLLEVLSTSVETALKQQCLGTTTVVLWCQIDLERWAATLSLEPASLLHILRSVVQEGILLPEQGVYLTDGSSVTWNLAFDTWPSLTAALPTKSADLQSEEDTDQPPWPHELLAKRWKGRPPRPVWWALRQRVLERDDYTCVYCGRRGGTLTLDHVLPVSRGGTSELGNLVTACVTCNSAKGTKTPQEWLAALQQRAGRA